MLGDAVDIDRDFELEDLFTEDFYIESVKETYRDMRMRLRCKVRACFGKKLREH